LAQAPDWYGHYKGGHCEHGGCAGSEVARRVAQEPCVAGESLALTARPGSLGGEFRRQRLAHPGAAVGRTPASAQASARSAQSLPE